MSKKTAVVLGTVVVALGCLALPRDARALGPVGIEVGAKIGGGTDPYGSPPGTPALNSLGFGIGGRAGVTLLGLYGGLNIVYYLGGSVDIPGGGVVTTVSAHSLLYGAEFGYGFSLLGLLTIRPQVGVGNLSLTISDSGATGPSQTTGYLYIEPGVVGLVGLGTFFVGADVNALLLPSGLPKSGTTGTSSFDSALTAHAQVGVKF